MNLSKYKLLFDPEFGQDGSQLDGDSVVVGISGYNLNGASKSLLRGDESGRIEAVGAIKVGEKAVLAAATIDVVGTPGADRTSGIVTITTTAAHGMSIGDVVVISGVTDSGFDGTFIIESVPSATTFTYHQAGADTTSGDGTALDETKNPRPLLLGALDATSNAKSLVASASGHLMVAATDLDIRDLVHTDDSVKIGDGTDFLEIYVDGDVWGAGSKGLELLAVRKDASGPLTGVADGDWTPLQVDENGALKVNASVTLDEDFVYEEDSAAAGGELGAYVLSVRQDTLATDTSDSGDFASFKVNSRGALWSVPVGSVDDDVADTEYPVKIGSKVSQTLVAVSNTGDRANVISDMYRRLYIHDAPNRAMSASTVTVGVAETVLPAATLAGRTRMFVQNRGNKSVYIGPTGVTTASGIEVTAGGAMSLEIGDQIAIYAISGTAGQDVRVMEFA